MMLVVMILLAQAFDSEPAVEHLTYTNYREMVEAPDTRVESIKVVADPVTPVGTLRVLEDGGEGERNYKQYTVNLPEQLADDLELWRTRNIPFDFEPRRTNWMAYILTSILPWVVLFGVWIFFLRRMQGGGGGSRGVFNFGKSRAKMSSENPGQGDLCRCSRSGRSQRRTGRDYRIPQGAATLQSPWRTHTQGSIDARPPGNRQDTAGPSGGRRGRRAFLQYERCGFRRDVRGALGASRVRDLFEQGKKSAPCIIFIDENRRRWPPVAVPVWGADTTSGSRP